MAMIDRCIALSSNAGASGSDDGALGSDHAAAFHKIIESNHIAVRKKVIIISRLYCHKVGHLFLQRCVSTQTMKRIDASRWEIAFF